MSVIINGLAKALKAKGFVPEDRIYVVGTETVDISGKKIDSFRDGHFNLSEKSIDDYSSRCSLLAVTFDTAGIFVPEKSKNSKEEPKEQNIKVKFVYSRDQHDPRTWRLTKTVANGMSYHPPIKNQSDVSAISINGNKITYHIKTEKGIKSEVLDISI